MVFFDSNENSKESINSFSSSAVHNGIWWPISSPKVHIWADHYSPTPRVAIQHFIFLLAQRQWWKYQYLSVKHRAAD